MNTYYVKGVSEEFGPFNAEELNNMQITNDALVRIGDTWTKATEIEEIALLIEQRQVSKGVMHWGDFKKDHCTGNGFRQYSSILWDIPYGQSWELTCKQTPAFVNGIYFPHPSRCVKNANMWGEFDVPDTSCITKVANLNLHIKILTPPVRFTINQMVAEMQAVYNTVGIKVNWLSTETLNLSDPKIVLLNDLNTGICHPSALTSEQIALSKFRKDAGSWDIVVYMCRTVFGTTGALNGCAAHPLNSPMAAVAASASLNTLGHEVGHVLGLKHVPEQNRLMTGGGTDYITYLPADLIPEEVETMFLSPFTN